MVITKSIGGDQVHQKVALNYLKQNVTPSEAIKLLKESNYCVSIDGTTYKLQASSVASIMTGFNLVIHQISTGRATCTKSKGFQWKD